MAQRKLNFSSYILNCSESKCTDTDWNFDDAASAQQVTFDATNTALISEEVLTTPSTTSKDLRKDWWPIENQGKTGACVGYATADGVLRWHYTQKGLIEQTVRPSVRFIWMANKETDHLIRYPTTFLESAGTSTKLALSIAQKYGCVLEHMLPMNGKLSPLPVSTFFAIAAQFRIKSYYNLGSGIDKLKDWRAWIDRVGPILTRLDVDETWMKAAKTKGELKRRTGQVKGGHAVCLVGYTKDHFIVRNSWGTDWGDEGFGYASNEYAAASFTEAYGATM